MAWEETPKPIFFERNTMSSIEAADVKKICLACEAGAGSSLMVKNSLIKKAKKAGLEVEIVHSPATQIPSDADIVVTPRPRCLGLLMHKISNFTFLLAAEEKQSPPPSLIRPLSNTCMLYNVYM